MNRQQSERGVRALCHTWCGEVGSTTTPGGDLSFDAFYVWLWQNYRQVLDFVPVTQLVRDDAEKWFDDEFNQVWKR